MFGNVPAGRYKSRAVCTVIQHRGQRQCFDYLLPYFRRQQLASIICRNDGLSRIRAPFVPSTVKPGAQPTIAPKLKERFYEEKERHIGSTVRGGVAQGFLVLTFRWGL